MLLAIHITVAILGLSMSGLSVVRPSRTKIIAGAALAIATVVSGFALVVFTQANLLHVCISGLFFTFLSLGFLYRSNEVLALQRKKY